MQNADGIITRKEFADLLGLELHAGLKSQVLESEDELFADKPVERRTAARILHQYIRLVKKLPDIEDIAPAMKLKDILDCHVCTNHIAQVYLRGIMPPVRADVFGIREKVSAPEAKEMVNKITQL